MDKKIFGKHLKQTRESIFDLNLAGMAEKTGLSVSYLNNLERGNFDKPKPNTIAKISKGYNVGVDLIKKVFKVDPREAEESMMMDVILKQIMADENLKLRKDLKKVLNHDLSKDTKMLIIKLYEVIYKRRLL